MLKKLLLSVIVLSFSASAFAQTLVPVVNDTQCVIYPGGHRLQKKGGTIYTLKSSSYSDVYDTIISGQRGQAPLIPYSGSKPGNDLGICIATALASCTNFYFPVNYIVSYQDPASAYCKTAKDQCYWQLRYDPCK